MSLNWIRETNAIWDADKARIVGAAEAGIFDRRYAGLTSGAVVLGEWWRVEDDGRTVGYGWLDVVWGDAEILLASDAGARGRGVGSFILEQLDHEARKRGLNYLYNLIRPGHPHATSLERWLHKRGFTPAGDGTLVRRVH